MTAGMATADLCDTNSELLARGDLRVLEPVFNIYGQKRSFHGQIVTVKVYEDNVLVRKLVKTGPAHGAGSVLMVDGGGIKRCALIGSKLAERARANGWGGIVVNGCVRDVDEINGCDIGVRALGTHPLKPAKMMNGDMRMPVYVAGTLIEDGEWLYADADGVLVSKTPLHVHQP